MVVGWRKHSRSPRMVWVELLVPRVVGWDKCSGTLGGLSY